MGVHNRGGGRHRRPRAIRGELVPRDQWPEQTTTEQRAPLELPAVASTPVVEETTTPHDPAPAEAVAPEPVDEISPELAAELLKRTPCSHCGGYHTRACPRVKSMSFDGNGGLTGVEFWKHWSEENIIWPETLAEIE